MRVDLADTDRGFTDGVPHGFVAFVAVRLSGRRVAPTVVGPHASDLLPLLTFAVSRRTSLLRLQRLVYAYPTFAGTIGTVADDFAPDALQVAGRGRRVRPLPLGGPVATSGNDQIGPRAVGRP